MGYVLDKQQIAHLISNLNKDYLIYAPKCYKGGGRFSDTDCIRYGEINSIDEIVFDKKSEYSFKEVLTPISQTLFYFTEKSVKESDNSQKEALVFLRSCDLHALKIMDEMYLGNGHEDYYYKRVRDKLHFVLMGCQESFDSCFCVDMQTNISDNYDLSIDEIDGKYYLDAKCDVLAEIIKKNANEEKEVVPQYVTNNKVHVNIPDDMDYRVALSPIWNEYSGRCINCGRCNFVCPTCTCWTMQDLFYDANGKVGERRRVWASCMVDGYSEVAGGGSYRKSNGERMRFKVLHKFSDYKKRTGHHMCVGCGRCDDICPEYISVSACVNKLEDANKEVMNND